MFCGHISLFFHPSCVNNSFQITVTESLTSVHKTLYFLKLMGSNLAVWRPTKPQSQTNTTPPKLVVYQASESKCRCVITQMFCMLHWWGVFGLRVKGWDKTFRFQVRIIHNTRLVGHLRTV